MTPATVQRLYKIHKITALIVAINLLILSITGAILTFRHELAELTLNDTHEEEPIQEGLPEEHLDLDSIVTQARAAYPEGTFSNLDVVAEGDHGYHYLGLVTGDSFQRIRVDPITGEFGTYTPPGGTWIDWVAELHIDLFLHLPGGVFVGLMGALFVISLITGSLVYLPFMKKRHFGEVRRTLALRFRLADLHKGVGAATLSFGLIVGVSGVLLALSFIPVQAYSAMQLQSLESVLPSGPPLPPEEWADVGDILSTARAALPNHAPYRILFPGGLQGDHLFLVFGWGDGTFGAYIPELTLHDAGSGALLKTLELPLLLKVISASGPFHFGDFGGLPVKFLYAALSLLLAFMVLSGTFITLKKGILAPKKGGTR